MTMRFATWNLHRRRDVAAPIQFVQKIAPALLALQEVSVAGYQALVESGLFAWSVFSLTLRPPLVEDGPKRQLGCAVFGQAACSLRSQRLLDHLPVSERALVVEVASPDGPLTVCSFHVPPGASWGGAVKSQTLTLLADWLASQPGHIIVGMDANAPKVDHPDMAKMRYWWPAEAHLFGPQRRHHLHDALRVWLAAHPDEFERIRQLRPSGPLAFSYDRGHKGISIWSRYDHVLVTPDVSVEHVDYLYPEAIAAGSDHALVLADLTLR